MRYQIVVPKAVQKQLNRLPKSIRSRVNDRVQALSENPRPPGCKRLKGYRNRYRIRVGNYRVQYEVYDDELVVILVRAAHRKDSYEN